MRSLIDTLPAPEYDHAMRLAALMLFAWPAMSMTITGSATAAPAYGFDVWYHVDIAGPDFWLHYSAPGGPVEYVAMFPWHLTTEGEHQGRAIGLVDGWISLDLRAGMIRAYAPAAPGTPKDDPAEPLAIITIPEPAAAWMLAPAIAGFLPLCRARDRRRGGRPPIRS